MTHTKKIMVLTCLTSLGLSGCGTMYSNAKILEQVNANIAVTVNKDFSSTVINTHTGDRVEPCVVDIKEGKRSVQAAIEECYPEGHDPHGEVRSMTNITVREGSVCITIVSGSRGYVLCQPPLNLGF